MAGLLSLCKEPKVPCAGPKSCTQVHALCLVKPITLSACPSPSSLGFKLPLSERSAGQKPCGAMLHWPHRPGGCWHSTGVQDSHQLDPLGPSTGLEQDGMRIFLSGLSDLPGTSQPCPPRTKQPLGHRSQRLQLRLIAHKVWS